MTYSVQGGTIESDRSDTAQAPTQGESLWARMRDQMAADEVAARIEIRIDHLAAAMRDCDNIEGVADWFGVSVDKIRIRTRALTPAEIVYLDGSAGSY